MSQAEHTLAILHRLQATIIIIIIIIITCCKYAHIIIMANHQQEKTKVKSNIFSTTAISMNKTLATETKNQFNKAIDSSSYKVQTTHT